MGIDRASAPESVVSQESLTCTAPAERSVASPPP
ncbi:hypothetical protein ENKNEFLB_00562 [Nocardioides aquaticus]|uniref:Uncharacterized protein n=1 Tax=Nocardioides aquaticus TaxID=160826 RepID=A0ABX8ECS4_9ACTN|nr:hypothetical protein ENKNEFLB_00562 [Nocardioides aquaticus]